MILLTRHLKVSAVGTSLTGSTQTNRIFLNVYNYIDIKEHIVKFRDFQELVKNLPTFNLNDVRKFDPDFHRQQFNDWLGRGYIQPLAGGYYLLADRQIDEGYLFMVANRIYEPSYISRESALANYLVIPETVLGVTSVSSRKTRQFDSQWGVFSYRSIKPALMFGYRVIEREKLVKYKIASLENMEKKTIK